MLTRGIAYQNKDIEFKLFSEAYRERSFRAYGLELPCITLRIEQAFIARLPGEELIQRIAHKLERKQNLTEEELMQLAILPLAGKGAKEKRRWIEKVIKLARQIEKEPDQIFVLTGLLVSTDKFIDGESAETIRRLLDMTKVGRMLFEEGLEEGIGKGIEKGIEAMALDNLEEGTPKERICRKLQERFSIEVEKAEEYL